MNTFLNQLPSALRNVQVPQSLNEFKNMDTKSQLVFTGLAGVGTFVSIKVINKMFGSDPLGKTSALLGKFKVQESSRKIDVNEMIDGYNELHDDATKSLEERNAGYTSLVNAYYELAT